MKRSPVPRAVPALALLLALAGCVERKMMIRSDPPGALITIDGEPTTLRTPAEIPFDFGGTRAITLAAPGRKVLDATAEVSDPWFTYFPLDIGAEFLWPFTIHDVQTSDYKLEPYAQWSPDRLGEAKKLLSDLKLRAEEYRAGGSEGPGKVAPPPAPAPDASTPKK